jgi:hypothetical protein
MQNFMTSAEVAAIQAIVTRGQWSVTGFNKVSTMGWFALGTSRNVKFAGNNDDDNDQDAWCVGFEYTR